MATLSDFEAKTLAGSDLALGEFAGKTVLVVNVASACGNTPQYAGLQKLYADLSPRGLVVLGFPCNQFGAQEPGSADEIAAFCSTEYRVTFPMFAKVDVNGPGAHELFAWLKSETPGSDGRDIEWNFVKFLVGPEGNPVARYGDKVQPEELRADIEVLLTE
ncbi:MAG: glutathione peroxidase [Hyphomicrobiaceae bacterium]|nr:glutathione peroxidase [Hyphomicrobiaceae bacterium]MCC0023458.1 glutathione peroxidase [Hyphomicrobiaceae bacterium]